MRKTTHSALGISSALIVSNMYALNPLLSLIIGVVYALLPDIDTGYSFISKYLIRVKWLRNKFMPLYYLVITVVLFAIYYKSNIKIFLVLSIMTTLLAIGKHRTYYHSFLILPLQWIVLYMLRVPVNFQALALINYVMHLVLDMFNVSGVMLFYPISKKAYKFPITINSASIISKIVEFAVTTCIISVTVFYFYNTF